MFNSSKARIAPQPRAAECDVDAVSAIMIGVIGPVGKHQNTRGFTLDARAVTAASRATRHDNLHDRARGTRVDPLGFAPQQKDIGPNHAKLIAAV
jgi:hypothetical protein